MISAFWAFRSARLTVLAKEDNEKERLLSALSLLPCGNFVQLHEIRVSYPAMVRRKKSAALIPCKLEYIS